MSRILAVFGTRPEAIKMCPLVLELKRHGELETFVCLTGQHREMLQQVMSVFSVRGDENLDIMQDGQSLTTVTCAVLAGMGGVLERIRPDIVLVHGDTTTSFAAALAAYYRKIPVGHVEAGLRSGNIYSPFPEEMNRLITDRISSWHFAPTEGNRDNLLREGITGRIHITGNTVIDAFSYTVRENYVFSEPTLKAFFSDGKDAGMDVVVLTAHRRENFGEPMRHIFRAVRRLVHTFETLRVVYPVHPNPAVHDMAHEMLGQEKHVFLTKSLNVLDMHNLLARCKLVLTDSGGLQEEAPAFGKPVLVLRTETERPEAVKAGTALVVGVEEQAIWEKAAGLLEDEAAYRRMACAVNPYGDGHASERIVRCLMDERKAFFDDIFSF